MKFMKILLLLTLAAITFACSEDDTKQDMPQTTDTITVADKAKNFFSEKYPNATGVEWKEDDKGWEVEFKIGSVKYESKFASDGDWLLTESKISESEIPQLIQNIIDGEYTAYAILEVEKYDTRKGEYYEIKLQKGGDIEEIIFYPDGKMTKPEWEKDKKAHSDMDND